MQLVVKVRLEEPLVLPINYQHILQAIIYNALNALPDYTEFLHDYGYAFGQRQYKMFNFSQLEGEYKIKDKQIIFKNYVSFEIRSPEPLLIRLIGGSFAQKGICFGKHLYTDLNLQLYDYNVEENTIIARVKAPITVYETNEENETIYYSPDNPYFYEMINQNFVRKYKAYYGVTPTSYINIENVNDVMPKKCVTKYKGSYITAWYGTYKLSGERKYLDFLYQTGLGSKNSQGFGMFEILNGE